MSAIAQVTIDGREIEVPAGTGLVEAAAEAGIEIPVFCYEPRVGPAVGACRMCLVEIEGLPKLQTACSTPVRDGMVVTSASKRARDAQEAVLEFLLVNHPLDCPVCDKGGECPLQDHAFRWGPGTTRFIETKRTNDKPIPISPLIALDRERCILCYRCTRFSSDVTGDNQLVTLERGADSVIATFDGRPYAAHASGNIIELCPVGALTSTEFRFRSRPWDSPDLPSVCTLCPVGCNVQATVRDGEVVRVLGRENAAVDNGWICDRARFSYDAWNGDARITKPRESTGAYLSMEGALEWLHRRLTSAAEKGAGAAWVLSGHETLEQVWAARQLAAATGGRVVAMPGASSPLPPHPATLADVRTANNVVVVLDHDLADAAPVLDLHVREAMRNGASITVVGIGGTALEVAGATHVAAAPHARSEALTAWAAGAGAATRDGATIVIAPDGVLDDATCDALEAALGLASDGSGIVTIPAAPNARGLAALGVDTATLESLAGMPLVFMGGEPDLAFDKAALKALISSAPWTVCVSDFVNSVYASAALVMPAASVWERDGTSVSLDGRLQRVRPLGDPPAEIRDEYAWLAELARRAGVEMPHSAAGAFARLAENVAALPARTWADIPGDGVAGVVTGAARQVARAVPDVSGELALHVAPTPYDGAEVLARPTMSFLRNDDFIHLSEGDAARIGVRRRDTVNVTADDNSFLARVAISSRLVDGVARVRRGNGRDALRSDWYAASISRVAETATAAVAASDDEAGGAE